MKTQHAFKIDICILKHSEIWFFCFSVSSQTLLEIKVYDHSKHNFFLDMFTCGLIKTEYDMNILVYNKTKRYTVTCGNL